MSDKDIRGDVKAGDHATVNIGSTLNDIQGIGHAALRELTIP